MANNDDDNGTNTSNNETFQEVLDARLSRRDFLGSSLTTAVGISLGVNALLKAVPASAMTAGRGRQKPLLGFHGIDVSTADTVTVPPGYTAEVLIAWGDPVSRGPAFEPDASNSADDQARQWGMHNDGLVYFPIDGSRHGLLAENNEYADEGLLFPDGVADWNEEKTNKSLNAHGVSIIEIKRGRGTITTAAAGTARRLRRAAIGTSSVRRGSRAASPARPRCGSEARRLETTGSRP